MRDELFSGCLIVAFALFVAIVAVIVTIIFGIIGLIIIGLIVVAAIVFLAGLGLGLLVIRILDGRCLGWDNSTNVLIALIAPIVLACLFLVLVFVLPGNACRIITGILALFFGGLSYASIREKFRLRL